MRIRSDKLTIGIRADTVDDIISVLRVAYARDFPTPPPVRHPCISCESVLTSA